MLKVNKTFQGAWVLSKNGYKMQYMGYTLKQAKLLFKIYLKSKE